MRTILLCFMVQLSSMLLAQDLPSVHQTYHWHSQEKGWELSKEFQYSYDDRDSIQQRVELEIGWTLHGPVEDHETTYRFDREGGEIYKLRRLREPGANWDNQRRERKSVNAQGEEVQTFEQWQDGQWQIYRLIRSSEQTLGGTQVRIAYLEVALEEGGFMVQTQDSSILDDQGRVIRRWKYVWEEINAPRLPFAYYETEYSDRGDRIYNRIEILYPSPLQVLEYRRHYLYDDEDRVLEMQEERRNNTDLPDWQTICLEQNAYDLQGRLTEQYHENTMDKARKLYEYRGDTIITTKFRADTPADLQASFRYREIPHPRHQGFFLYQQQEKWEDGVWDFGKEEVFEFTDDEYGNVATIYRSTHYKHGSLEGNYLRFERKYDKEGRVLSEIKHRSNPMTKEEWPVSKDIWIYDTSRPASQNAFLLYPQPNQGQVNIQLLRQNSPPVALSVYDQGGRLVFSQRLQMAAEEVYLRFSLEQISGLYLVQLQYQDGSTQAQKLILE
ncbi:MAG: T9SS type A sorting domain-containing protein [Bacteroidota bacterium]